MEEINTAPAVSAGPVSNAPVQEAKQIGMDACMSLGSGIGVPCHGCVSFTLLQSVQMCGSTIP